MQILVHKGEECGVYLDALRVNSRESGKNQNKALYIALGINMEGRKEVLGFYLSDTEGAKFWMGVLTDLKNRGVNDIFIACMDGLTGFPDAVRAVFPQTKTQLRIVHMIRNSTRFVSYKDLKAICKDLKKIYTASTEEEALLSLDDFGKAWNSKYLMIQKSWLDLWDDLSEFFAYPEEIRRVIYTTNAIESLKFSLRKVTKKQGCIPNRRVNLQDYVSCNKQSLEEMDHANKELGCCTKSVFYIV